MHPDTHWFHYGDVDRETVSSFKTFYEDAWKDFVEVPPAVRDLMFGYFSTLFTWDFSLDVQVRAVWEAKLHTRMSHSVYRARMAFRVVGKMKSQSHG